MLSCPNLRHCIVFLEILNEIHENFQYEETVGQGLNVGSTEREAHVRATHTQCLMGVF
jgi:hypothetical protein